MGQAKSCIAASSLLSEDSATKHTTTVSRHHSCHIYRHSGTRRSRSSDGISAKAPVKMKTKTARLQNSSSSTILVDEDPPDHLYIIRKRPSDGGRLRGKLWRGGKIIGLRDFGAAAERSAKSSKCIGRRNDVYVRKVSDPHDVSTDQYVSSVEKWDKKDIDALYVSLLSSSPSLKKKLPTLWTSSKRKSSKRASTTIQTLPQETGLNVAEPLLACVHAHKSHFDGKMTRTLENDRIDPLPTLPPSQAHPQYTCVNTNAPKRQLAAIRDASCGASVVESQYSQGKMMTTTRSSFIKCRERRRPASNEVTCVSDPFQCSPQPIGTDNSISSMQRITNHPILKKVERGYASKAFAPEVMRASPGGKAKLLCVDKDAEIYVLDTGLTPNDCSSIIATAEKCSHGCYTSYTYAKQTLGCRDHDDLAAVCQGPVGIAYRSVTHAFGLHQLVLDQREPHLVKYDTTKRDRKKLDMHTDKSERTFLISLSEGGGLDFEGGGTYFEQPDVAVHLQQGLALIFPGKLRHKGLKITSGQRFLLAGFLVDPPPLSTPPPAIAVVSPGVEQ